MKINTILIVKYQETTSFDILVDEPIIILSLFRSILLEISSFIFINIIIYN